MVRVNRTEYKRGPKEPKRVLKEHTESDPESSGEEIGELSVNEEISNESCSKLTSSNIEIIEPSIPKSQKPFPYTLDNARVLHLKNPKTFQIPTSKECCDIPIGHMAKLLFSAPTGEDEMMWVRIVGKTYIPITNSTSEQHGKKTRRDILLTPKINYIGRLVNSPIFLTRIKTGYWLEFDDTRICDIRAPCSCCEFKSDEEDEPENLINEPCYNGICTNAVTSVCAQCQSSFYCGVPCQREDWTNHKLVCKQTLKTALLYKKKLETMQNRYGFIMHIDGDTSNNAATNLRRVPFELWLANPNSKIDWILYLEDEECDFVMGHIRLMRKIYEK